MRITRRMRLIWKNLGALPLMGLAIDVVAQEVARLAHRPSLLGMWIVTLGYSALALLLAGERAMRYPRLPDENQAPDAELTQRSRVLCQRLQAKAVRVMVAPLPKRRREELAFIADDDLFLSPHVAELPARQRDFAMAKALSGRTVASRMRIKGVVALLYAWVAILGIRHVVLPGILAPDFVNLVFVVSIVLGLAYLGLYDAKVARRFGPDRDLAILALKATGDLEAAVDALKALSGTDKAAKKAAEAEEQLLLEWWRTKGSIEVPKSDWYPLEFPAPKEGAGSDREP